MLQPDLKEYLPGLGYFGTDGVVTQAKCIRVVASRVAVLEQARGQPSGVFWSSS
jgi:hypothetical protein